MRGLIVTAALAVALWGAAPAHAHGRAGLASGYDYGNAYGFRFHHDRHYGNGYLRYRHHRGYAPALPFYAAALTERPRVRMRDGGCFEQRRTASGKPLLVELDADECAE